MSTFYIFLREFLKASETSTVHCECISQYKQLQY